MKDLMIIKAPNGWIVQKPGRDACVDEVLAVFNHIDNMNEFIKNFYSKKELDNE